MPKSKPKKPSSPKMREALKREVETKANALVELPDTLTPQPNSLITLAWVNSSR